MLYEVITKDYEKAATWLDKALRINQNMGANSAALCYNMGFIYKSAGRTQKAKDKLTRAVQIDPGHEKAKALLEKLSA